MSEPATPKIIGLNELDMSCTTYIHPGPYIRQTPLLLERLLAWLHRSDITSQNVRNLKAIQTDRRCAVPA